MKLIIHEGSGKWLSLLILLLFCQGIIAQPKAGKERIDSLLSELPKAKEDTNKYLLLYSISRGCIETGKSQEAIQYGEQALTLATSLHKQNGVKNAHYLIGVGYFGLNEYTKALEHINFVLKSNEESKNKEGISMCNMMIGNIYSHQSNYPKALEYFMKALKIGEERKNAYMLAQDYGSIGQIYSYMKANDKAIEYMLKSVRYAEQIGDKMALSNTYNNLAEIYYNQDKKDIALEYFFKSLKLHIEIGDLPDVATNYNNIGLIYQDKKEYAKGLDFYNKSYEIARQLDDKSRSALCLGNMSLLSILLKNYKLAKVEALKAIGFAKDIGDVDNMRLGYEHLADAEFGLGEYKEAYNSQVLCKKMTDSIFNIENSKQLSDIKTKYEVDKKATELNAANKIKEAIQYAQIKHQKQQKNYFIAGFFISLVFAGFIFRSLRTRNKQNKIITQQKEIVEKEKNRSEELLLNILPSEVAEELKSTGSAKAKNFEEVTVMFTDFKGFTQISEKLTPEQLQNYCSQKEWLRLAACRT